MAAVRAAPVAAVAAVAILIATGALRVSEARAVAARLLPVLLAARGHETALGEFTRLGLLTVPPVVLARGNPYISSMDV